MENPGIHFSTAYNNAHFVDILFRNVWDELAVAVLLTGIVVFFFLGVSNGQTQLPTWLRNSPEGDMTQMMTSFRRMLAGLLIAIVLMYLVLVAQFRGFLQPLQRIASIPLELAGIFTALWLAHQAFSTVSILGVIVRAGWILPLLF